MANIVEMVKTKFASFNTDGSEVEARVIEKLEKIKPMITRFTSVGAMIKSSMAKFVEFTPMIYTVIALISMLVVTGYILWHVFFKKTIPGIEGARKAYSIFHLITSCMIVISIFVVANPINDESDTPSLKVGQLRPLFNKVNSFINCVSAPVLLVETIFIVLTVFIINFMFLIISSLLRTYYAIQCPVEQSIEYNWWGRIIDLVMFCLLGVSFVFMLITQILYGIFSLYASKLNSKISEAIIYIISLSRRFFVMTLSYYILYSLFLGIEYFISSNILAIHNWKKDDPSVVCTSELSGAKKSNDNKFTAEYLVKILYLIFNVVLCIVIWILIGVLIYGHGILAGTASKIVKVLVTVNEVLLHFSGGNMSENTIKTAIKNMLGRFKSIIPENMIPREYRDTDKLVAMLQEKLLKILPQGLKAETTEDKEKLPPSEKNIQGNLMSKFLPAVKPVVKPELPPSLSSLQPSLSSTSTSRPKSKAFFFKKNKN